MEIAIDNGFGENENIVCKGEKFDLKVDYVMADDKNIAMFLV